MKKRVLEPNEQFPSTIGTPEIVATKDVECPYCNHDFELGIYKDRELLNHYSIMMKKKGKTQ